MSWRFSHRAVLVAAFLCAIGAYAQVERSVGTAFTYQGQLTLPTGVVDEACDFEFKLFDSELGPTQVGTTVALSNVDVTHGLFTVSLDFGASAFDGGERWLEIAVRCPAGTGILTTLAPRQKLTPSPYALYSLGPWTTNGADISFVSGAVGIGGQPGGSDRLFVDGPLRINAAQTAITAVGSSDYGIFAFGGARGVYGIGGMYGVYGKGTPWGLYAEGDIGATGSVNVQGGYLENGSNVLNNDISGNADTVDGFHASYVDAGGGPTYNPPGALLATDPSNGRIYSRVNLSSNAIYAQNDAAGGTAIFGTATNASSDTGVKGRGQIGVSGEGTGPFGIGLYGSGLQFAVFANGDYGGTGAKYFIQPHPYDPSKEIRFVCLEGNEAGTYFRGTASLVNGRAVIPVPEEFRLVTEPHGITIQVTALGPDAGIWVESQDLSRMVVRGNRDVEFNYFVNGVRRGYADLQIIQNNHSFVPRRRGVPFGSTLRDAVRHMLVENGILNADYTPNEHTAKAMGWHLENPDSQIQDTDGVSQ